MLIGVDLDNTIVCYDGLFHRLALELDLIPADLPIEKNEVRDFLRNAGKEDRWTEMQGQVYGARMNEAEPYPGVMAFFRTMKNRGAGLAVVSHKTLHPYEGPRYDLHAAAARWLEEQGFLDPRTAGLDSGDVYFEVTKEQKIDRIRSLGCHCFIDDHPDILFDPAFPAGVKKVLFDPKEKFTQAEGVRRCASWEEITSWLETTSFIAG